MRSQLLRSLMLSVSTLMICACSMQSPATRPQPLPPLVKCPDTLPEFTDGTKRSSELTIASWGRQYHDCKDQHNGLVDFLKGAGR